MKAKMKRQMTGRRTAVEGEELNKHREEREQVRLRARQITFSLQDKKQAERRSLNQLS